MVYLVVTGVSHEGIASKDLHHCVYSLFVDVVVSSYMYNNRPHSNVVTVQET